MKLNLILFVLFFGLLFPSPSIALDIKSERKELVRELTRLGIKNKKILKVFGEIPREKFATRKHLRLVYENKSFPIDGGRRLYQPYELAKMAELLDPKPGQKILQIGVGSGYEAAVLSKLYSHVYIVEIVKENSDKILKLLSSIGINNVTVRLGDPFRGVPKAAPFDAVICVANPPRLPQPLVDQTRPGGNLTASQGSKILFLHKGVSGELKKGSYKVKKSLKRRRNDSSEKTGWKIKRKTNRRFGTSN